MTQDILLPSAVITSQLPGVDLSLHAPRLVGPSVDLPDIETSKFNQDSDSGKNLHRELKQRLDLAEQLFLKELQVNSADGFFAGKYFLQHSDSIII